MNETNIMCVFVNLTRVTSIARATSLTVNNNLSIQSNWGWAWKIIKNVESISDCWCWTLSPTWTTVLGNVLVLCPGKIVLTVHVSPVNILWKITCFVNIPSVRSILDLRSIKMSYWNTAAIHNFWKECVLFSCIGRSRKYWLREWINSLVVEFAWFFSCSWIVHFTFSPSVFWSYPSAITFNCNVVHTAANTEETGFSPMSAPWVSYSPVFLTILSYTETNNWNIVNHV